MAQLTCNVTCNKMAQLALYLYLGVGFECIYIYHIYPVYT